MSEDRQLTLRFVEGTKFDRKADGYKTKRCYILVHKQYICVTYVYTSVLALKTLRPHLIQL